MYNAISLFSGAMGLDLGVEKAGVDIKLCVENNKYACNTIRKNTQIPLIEEDINNVTSEQMLKVAGLKKEDVFLIIGGPPCQAFSTAGKGKSLEDARGNLILKYFNTIREINPKFFIMENVRGLLYAKIGVTPKQFGESYKGIEDKRGSLLYLLKKEYEKIGYTISFALFNSANYGVPQKRERIIIFGHRGAERIPLPLPTHSEFGENGLRKWISLKEALNGLDEINMHHIDFDKKHQKYLSYLVGGQYWKHLPKELQEEALGKAYFLTGGRTGFYRRLDWEKPSPTLVTSPRMPATMLCHPDKDRPLSIQEYARIQQFPDNWIFSGSILEVYRQLGNAVPVGMGYIAAKNIIDFHENKLSFGIEEEKEVKFSRYNNTIDYEFIKNFI